MPEKKVKRKGGKLTEDQKANLIGGHSVTAIMAKGNKNLFKDEEARREAWEANKDRLYNLKHDNEKGFVERRAYTRPRAFWDYEATEPWLEGEGRREYLVRLGLDTEWDRDKAAREKAEGRR